MSSSELDPGTIARNVGQYRRRMLVYLAGKYRDQDESSIARNIECAWQVALEL